MSWPALAALALALAAPAAPPRTPADAARAALADARARPAEAAYLRYLWLPNLPEADRALWRTVLSGHCNELSTTPDLTPVRAAGGDLVAVSLLDYGWRAEVWDKLADADPTFYATVTVREEVYWEGGVVGGRRYAPGRYYDDVRKRALAPWLGPEAAELARLTRARAPIVNVYVFFDNTATSGDGRTPGYYEMLGIKDEKTFRKVTGVELGRDKAFAGEVLEAVGVSGVTQEPRGIERTEKVGGGYWRTYDVFRGTAVDKKNALRALGTDAGGTAVLDYDASEQYAHLPNGLWATGLFNAGGELQTEAPPNVALDPEPITRNNHRILVNVSCKRCHSDGGLQDVDGWVRNNFTPPPFTLLAQTPEDARRLRQQYGRKLGPFLAADRARYAAALKEATGLTPPEYAKAYLDAWKQAADTDRDPARAARELGVTPERLRRAVEGQLRAKGVADPVLAALARGRAVPAAQWRESYPLAQQYLAEVADE